VAVLADQPLPGGVPDAHGTERFRRIVERIGNFDLPLVMVSNAPGFLPGAQQERLRIQQIGGESLDANVLNRAPVVSVTLHQNFGGRQIHAFSKFLRPGIASIALSHATMAARIEALELAMRRTAERTQIAAATDRTPALAR